VGVPRNARDGSRGYTAFGNFVSLVGPVAIGPGGCFGDQFPAIDDDREVQVLRIDTEPAFRQQEIAEHNAGALESIRNIENLRDDFEAVSDIEWCGQHPGIIAERSAQHLPEIALIGLGGYACGWTGPLAVDYHHRSFHHG
jgi:hypothetical protein